GLATHHRVAAAVAGAGAVTVGLGAFQRIGNSRVAPMLLATLGMVLATFAGTVAGHSTVALTIVAASWGFLYGLFFALGAGASWAALQSVISLLVAGGFPQPLEQASVRTALILAGGLLQMLSLVLLSYAGVFKREEARLPPIASRQFLPAARAFLRDSSAS